MLIKDLNFKHKGSDEVTAKAVKWLKDNSSSFSYTANFCIYGEDKKGNTTISPQINRACHLFISQPNIDNRVVVASEIGRFRVGHSNGKSKTNDWTRGFYDWFINQSFASRFILNKDDSEEGIVVSADIPTPLLQNIMIITRHAYEVASGSFKLFDELVEKGLKPEVAYVLCFNTTLSTAYAPSDFVLRMQHPVTTYGGHRAWSIFTTVKAMQNFIDGNFGDTLTNAEGNHYRNQTSFYGGTGYCYNRGEYVPGPGNDFISDLVKRNPDLQALVADYRKQGVGGKKYSPPNPFVRVASPSPRAASPHHLTYKEVLEVAVPYIIENKVFG